MLFKTLAGVLQKNYIKFFYILDHLICELSEFPSIKNYLSLFLKMS